MARKYSPYRFWRYCPDDNHTCNARECLECEDPTKCPKLGEPTATTVDVPGYFRGQPITPPSVDPSDD